MPTNKDYIKCSNKERASALKTNASVTIEAAFAVPLFFFAMLCLIYLMELQNIKITLLNASQNAAKSAYKTTVLTPAFNTIKFKSDLIQLVGAERLEHSLLENGASSINCFGSYLNPGTGEINVTVNYKIRIPLPVFGSPTARQQIQFKIHSWTGYMNGHLDNDDPTIVYVPSMDWSGIRTITVLIFNFQSVTFHTPVFPPCATKPEANITPVIPAFTVLR